MTAFINRFGHGYNADVVKEAPESWDIFWNPQYAGKYTINNNFHVGNNDYLKTVAIWRVMSEKTEKAFGEMWEEAKEPAGK